MAGRRQAIARGSAAAKENAAGTVGCLAESLPCQQLLVEGGTLQMLVRTPVSALDALTHPHTPMRRERTHCSHR